jgi:hypothetical protein
LFQLTNGLVYNIATKVQNESISTFFRCIIYQKVKICRFDKWKIVKFISVREKNCIKKFISNRTEIIHHVLIYYNILNYKIKNNIIEKFASNNMKLFKHKGTLKKPFSASFDIVFIIIIIIGN